jgi:hypothetical protein
MIQVLVRPAYDVKLRAVFFRGCDSNHYFEVIWSQTCATIFRICCDPNHTLRNAVYQFLPM